MPILRTVDLFHTRHWKAFPWLNDVSSAIFQQSLRDQQAAFKNYWKKRAGDPSFKRKCGRQSIRLTEAAFRVKDGVWYIAT